MLRRIIPLRDSFVHATAILSPASSVLNTRSSFTQSSNSDKSTPEIKNKSKDNLKAGTKENPEPKKKTQLELDEELRQKLEGIAGDGGDAGRELEDGRPVAMKRGVKENMFRYI